VTWGTLALAASALVSSAPAAAQAPLAAEGDREAQRTKIYKEAVEAANSGRWSEAAEKLRAALAIRSSPKVRFTLGQAEEHVGRLSAAYDAYAQALADAEAAGERDVLSTARGALRALTPRVPVVRVTVSGAGADAATATIDDRSTPLGQPVRVDPGPHRISVSAPGARPTASTIAIGEGQQLDVPVGLERESAASSTGSFATGASREGGSGATWRTGGLVSAGVGVVGLGVGSYFGLDAISKNNASNSSGCHGNDCTASAFATREDARSAASVSTVAFIVGGLLAAGGVTLWLLEPHGSAAVEVAPSPLAGGGGVTVAGVWR
jgi:hypothetical protein